MINSKSQRQEGQKNMQLFYQTFKLVNSFK